MRYADLIRGEVIDLITVLDAEGINTVPMEVLQDELSKIDINVDSASLMPVLDKLRIVDNIKDGVVYFNSDENHGEYNSQPDPEKQDKKIDSMARKQVNKEIKK